MSVFEAADGFDAAWDTFVRTTPTGSFLQSWAWGDFQQVAGLPVRRLMVAASPTAARNDPHSLEAVCLLVRRALPWGRFSYSAPWGPVLAPVADRTLGTTEVLRLLTEYVRPLMRAGGVFTRLEPRLPAGEASMKELQAAGLLPATRSIQPKDTRVLDLTRSEDELLRDMHPKTRYNIRIARRHGVDIEEASTAAGLQAFLDLAREVERQGTFHYHPARYYETMLKVLTSCGMMKILLARHQGVVLAAHILLHFGCTVTYAHGASSKQRKHVMAPYLLQWESMLRAKTAGATIYDFFGIAPPGSPVSHPWHGITRFKSGFGGREEHFVGAVDLIADPVFYRLYEIGRGVRSLLR